MLPGLTFGWSVFRPERSLTGMRQQNINGYVLIDSYEMFARGMLDFVMLVNVAIRGAKCNRLRRGQAVRIPVQ